MFKKNLKNSAFLPTLGFFFSFVFFSGKEASLGCSDRTSDGEHVNHVGVEGFACCAWPTTTKEPNDCHSFFFGPALLKKEEPL